MPVLMPRHWSAPAWRQQSVAGLAVGEVVSLAAEEVVVGPGRAGAIGHQFDLG
jgi:hypothetical protein